MRPTIPLLLALAACVDRPVSEVIPDPDHADFFDVPTSVERDLDILFVIDSSQSMIQEHAALRASFSSLLDRLDDGEAGLPNVHIGVVSSDLGTAPYAADSLCDSTGGDRGLMRGSACAALGGNAFLEDVIDADGGRRRNYSGTLGDAFSCLADVGASGCGFEQHLEAMRVALGPATNPGFVRDHAALAVIFIADEDDCSASDPRLFDRAATDLGDFTDFRCHAQGIVCSDSPDPTLEGPRTGCRPDPDSAYLEHLDAYVDFLVALKGGRRDKVIVGGIIGDPSQVEIGRDDLGRLEVRAACPQGGLGASEPGLRFDAFFERMQINASASLCDGDLSVALDEIGRVIDDNLDLRYCLERPVADQNSMVGGIQPDCSLTQVDGAIRTVIPACDLPGAGLPCWRLVEDATCGAVPQRLEVDRGGVPGPEDGHIAVSCVVDDAGE